jgi:hypothetical protein
MAAGAVLAGAGATGRWTVGRGASIAAGAPDSAAAGAGPLGRPVVAGAVEPGCVEVGAPSRLGSSPWMSSRSVTELDVRPPPAR